MTCCRTCEPVRCSRSRKSCRATSASTRRLEDWWINLQAADGAGGQYVTAQDFEVSNDNWQLTIKDAADQIVFGPVGEGIQPVSGVGSDEVFKLEEDPDALPHPVRRLQRRNVEYLRRAERLRGRARSSRTSRRCGRRARPDCAPSRTATRTESAISRTTARPCPTQTRPTPTPTARATSATTARTTP